MQYMNDVKWNWPLIQPLRGTGLISMHHGTTICTSEMIESNGLWGLLNPKICLVNLDGNDPRLITETFLFDLVCHYHLINSMQNERSDRLFKALPQCFGGLVRLS